MGNALFDTVTNSEDEMIARTGIPRYEACTYLRAYIMSSLCFEPNFVISDSSANLNRAFRTLIDFNEGKGIYKLDKLPNLADFDQLICDGYIGFAVRDKYKENFSEALFQDQKRKKKTVDLPSEKYTKILDEICSDKNIHYYSLDDITHKFMSKFNSLLDAEFYNNAKEVTPETADQIKNLRVRLHDMEKYDYSDVKSILLEYCNEKDEAYQYIHQLMRKAYDNNVPELLKLDYSKSMENNKSSKINDWTLTLKCEEEFDFSFIFNVYGLAKLPVSHLKYILESTEYKIWEQQLNCFRAETPFDLNKYVVAIKNYLKEINKVVGDIYSLTSKHKETNKFNIVVGFNQFQSDSRAAIIVKTLNLMFSMYDVFSIVNSLYNNNGNNIDARPYVDLILTRLLPCIFKNLSDDYNILNKPFAPPKEIKEAVILHNKNLKDDE